MNKRWGPPHTHSWERLPRWSARYKCVSCECFGYRAVVNAKSTGNPEDLIIPYLCSRKGCRQPGVTKINHKWFCRKCSEHDRLSR